MIGSYLGTLLLFCSFVSICLSSNDLEEIYDVNENKEFFAKKSLDLYNKETKRLKMLPKSLDFAYFMFYDNSLEVVADSISKYFKTKTANKYDIKIYRPDFKTNDPFQTVVFQLFRIKRIYNTWYIVDIYVSKNLPQNKQTKNKNIILSQKAFGIFLCNFFHMYKFIKKICNYPDNYDDSFILIEDTSNNIRKKIPKKYQKLDTTLETGIYNIFCLKMFSEVENFNCELNENKMIRKFNKIFGEITCLLCGYYTVYFIEMNESESVENICSKKIFKTTKISLFRIALEVESLPLANKNSIFFLKKKFRFESSIHRTEFEYFYSIYNVNDKDYKFKIFLKHSDIAFEFNFNWIETQLKKSYIPNSSIYIYVIRGDKLYILEILEDRNRKYFRIKKANRPCACLHFDCKENIKYLNKNYELKELLNRLVFSNEIDIKWYFQKIE
ncbi:hypothetical protein LUQ84_003165 [Hamiltosporidium tvaerminnensis]|nr:hypothetical protein LUQ84_003165 [Hamiltosporidium tvaerminnensis]